jgi:protein gp37
MSTGIPYVDESCNAVIGCSKCSTACKNCWAVGTVKRLRECTAGQCGTGRFNYSIPLNESGDNWSGKAVVDFNAFKKCRTKTPKTFLLSSLGDWLHESLTTVQINSLLDEMRQYSQHRFYTLTKRPERWKELGPIPPNVWLGASVWDDESMSIAAYHGTRRKNFWVSMEPLLDQIASINIPIAEYINTIPSWVVVGDESGKNRRPCKIEWIRSIVQQCKEYKIPCFVKQIDLDGKCSTDPAEWPSDIRIQELPQ